MSDSTQFNPSQNQNDISNLSYDQLLSQVKFGLNGFEYLNEQLSRNDYSSGFILVDDNTKFYCLKILLVHCPILSNYHIIEIKHGEINKKIKTCSFIWNVMIEKNADRKSVLVNLGGGVLTDIGSFVASTFERGIDFYNVPTTLLSMVDASVGGKTGINFNFLKNLIGTFTQPQGVVIGIEFLKTLPERELISGFAEMLKHGLILDLEYWNELKELNLKYWRGLKGADKQQFQVLERQIRTSVSLKAHVVSKDPNEKEYRKILNFGHTWGHAIESFYLKSHKYKTLLHGEAIAIGMILEGYLSNKLTRLPQKSAEEIRDTIRKFYPRVKISKSDQSQIFNLLKHDKKTIKQHLNFIFLEEIGQVVETNTDVSVLEAGYGPFVEEAFDFYLKD